MASHSSDRVCIICKQSMNYDKEDLPLENE